MTINDWWRELPEERYWMIAPSRGIVGDALVAPKAGEDRRFEWSHELVGFTEPGDTLFVWDRTLPVPGIGAWGRVLGPLGEETRARRGDELPHWRMPVSDTLRLASPITLPNLRRVGAEIVAIRDRVEALTGRPGVLPVHRRSRNARTGTRVSHQGAARPRRTALGALRVRVRALTRRVAASAHRVAFAA